MLLYFLAYLLCGCCVGFAAGLLGIGGGIIGIPVLLLLFKLQHVPESMAMHMAIGTLLATVVLTSISSILSHYTSGQILFAVFKKVILGTLVGCILGIVLASHLNGVYLQRIFGVFLLCLAAQYFFRKEFKMGQYTFRMKYVFLVTTSIGALSGLLGLGGGIFIVPYLNWCGVSMRNAIATSSVCILPVALVGAAGYIYAGMNVSSALKYNTGFVDWPAFFGIAVTSILFAPLGAKVTHSISPHRLKKIFSIFLGCVGISMLI